MRAGSGDRTRIVGLEGRRSTIELYPQVGERGFEPPTPASQTLCAARLRYSPLQQVCIIAARRDINNNWTALQRRRAPAASLRRYAGLCQRFPACV